MNETSVRLPSTKDWAHVVQGIYEGVDAEYLEELAEIFATTNGRLDNKSRRSAAVQDMASALRHGQ